MAIDDNTTYGLTGAQIKELPELTAGNYKTLTTADYNYPTTGTKTAVATWLLPSGIYTNSNGVTIKFDASLSPAVYSGTFVVSSIPGSNYTAFIYFSANSSPASYLLDSTGARRDALSFKTEDSLTSTTVQVPLSANQGKVLKDTIDGLITLTDTDPGEGSALAAGKYVAVYGEDPLIMDYSTSEVNTGMKWIDGKVIYKKTINNLNMPTSSSHTAATAHSITGLDKVIKTEGSLINANGEAFQLGYGDGSNNDTILYVGSTNVNIYSVADKSAWTGFVTLYYTKTSS